MAIYLKKFENHTEYEEARQNLILPNVSYCVSENEVHYNPYVPETRVVAKYNVTDTSNPTNIGCITSGFSVIEIDGVAQPSVVSAYTFDTVGEHTVKYTLADTTKVVSRAFMNCINLTNIIIPDSVTSIGGSAFYQCSGLTSIAIPNGVTSIGNSAFNNCSSLTSIVIPDSVTSIGRSAFFECVSLTSIEIPSGVTSIGASAFTNCSSLTSIEIPNSVTSIGDRAFFSCPSLASITVDNDNAIFDSRNSCNGIIETATNTLVAGCKNTIIPNTVTSIGDYAFDGCFSLTSITIPSSITSIGNYAFAYCDDLISVICDATTPPTLGSDAFEDTNNCPIYVPSGSVDAYKAASGWSEYASRIQPIA